MSTKKRRGLAAVVAVLTGCVTPFAGASPARAAWSGTINGGPTSSYGFYNYDWAVPAGTGSDWLRLQSNPTTLATGKCYDTILDWNRLNQHYDARLARSCKSVTVRNTQVSHESPHNLTSINRLGICYGPNQATNGTGGVCNFEQGGPAGIPTNVGASQFCVRAWSMRPNGELQFFGGGDPTECGE